jgi:hypothetical protein
VFKEVPDNATWKLSFSDSSKISIVDASELIYYNVHFKPLRAHNDIYTPGIAEFIWNCINNLPVRPRMPGSSTSPLRYNKS